MKIIPKPNGICTKRTGSLPAYLVKGANLGGFPAWILQAFAARSGLSTKPVPQQQARMHFVQDAALGAEAYRLTVYDDGIMIAASSERGAVWALTSLYTLMEDDGFPYVTIEDTPKYAHRGFMLDCARHFFPVDVVKAIIEQNALLKLNVFHWHLTDDQAWRIESKRFPQLHTYGGQAYYTQSEIKEVVEYAAVRGVEVIPEIDMPGHTTAMIAAFPQLSCKAKAVVPPKKGGIYKTILCAGKDDTYTFLRELLDEVCPLFPSPHFHLGGDEAPKDEWQNCPHCRAKLASCGGQNYEDLQGFFTQALAEMLAANGKMPVLWNDVLKSDILPEPFSLQHWVEMADIDRTRPYLAKGGSVVFSDMFHLYFDYPLIFTGLQRVYSYTPQCKGNDFTAHTGTAGIEACLWSERVADAETLYKQIYPRLFALAEAAWTNERNYNCFEARLAHRLKQFPLAYTPISESNPEGAARLAAIQQYTQYAIAAAGANDNAPVFTPEMIQQFLAGFDISIPIE